MLLTMINNDLFSIPDNYYKVHCISSDCALGKGIAPIFEERYNLRRRLLEIPIHARIPPTCILIDNIFNLVTKESYFDKPTYKSLEESLVKMCNMIELMDIKQIAMPRIGCGLDRLSWKRVREIIIDIFQHTKIHILVCII